jgi:phosphate starvation-inducible PhoH-like protein
MAKRNKIQDDKDYAELVAVDDIKNISHIKKIIGDILPNDIKVIAKNESQKELIKSIKNNEITVCSGPAGTGKTFVSVAYALRLLRAASNRYKKIYLIKSVTTLKNEEIGYLKGGLEEKIEPFMWSFYINMEKIIMKSLIEQLIAEDIIRPFPLAYMRGASLDDCIIIADEMQNVTLDNARTLLTRIGSNCKLLLLGDRNQIDLKNKTDSSLEIILDLFEGVENFGVIRMSEEDTNVRNPLISTIENKFKEYYETKLLLDSNNPTIKSLINEVEKVKKLNGNGK